MAEYKVKWFASEMQGAPSLGDTAEGALTALLKAVLVTGFGTLTINALAASDGVIIPMQCEYYALEGLTDLVNSIQRIGQALNPSLKIEGLLRTMYDPRSSLTNDVSEQLKAHFGDKLYDTVIPRNVRLAEAPSHGMPALVYDKQSKGALAYLALAGELSRRQRQSARGAPA